jgi:hypothetical protein
MNKQFISAVFVGISLTVLPLNAAAPGTMSLGLLGRL